MLKENDADSSSSSSSGDDDDDDDDCAEGGSGSPWSSSITIGFSAEMPFCAAAALLILKLLLFPTVPLNVI